MVKFRRLGLVLMLTMFVALAAETQAVFAQRSGGLGAGGGSNNNDSQDGNRNRNRNRTQNNDNNQNSDSADLNLQQLQQMIQGGQQGGQIQQGQGGSQQFRRSGQPNQNFQGQNFQGQGFQGQGNRRQGGQFIQQGGNQQQMQNAQQWQNFQQQGGWPSDRRRNSQWVMQFSTGPQPFTTQWYTTHPNAWKHNHPHSDAWAVATTAGIIGWLGGRGTANNGVIYETVPGQTVIVDGQPVVVDPNAGEWMPFGVYTMLTAPGDSGTRLLQLAVDRAGTIRGTYYDMITNTTHNVSGRINEASHRVRWSLDANKQLTFTAPLSQLTQSQGFVTVKLPGGEQQWQVVRIENDSN